MDMPNKEDARKQSMKVKLVTKLTNKSIAFDETWLSLYEEANKHVNKGVAILTTMAHAHALDCIAKHLKTPDNPKDLDDQDIEIIFGCAAWDDTHHKPTSKKGARLYKALLLLLKEHTKKNRIGMIDPPGTKGPGVYAKTTFGENANIRDRLMSRSLVTNWYNFLKIGFRFSVK